MLRDQILWRRWFWHRTQRAAMGPLPFHLALGRPRHAGQLPPVSWVPPVVPPPSAHGLKLPRMSPQSCPLPPPLGWS